jgi:hypothetical protein
LSVTDGKDQRQYPRVPHRSHVRVVDEQGRSHEVYTRDLSHGGLFIKMNVADLPDFGSRITVQALDIEDALVNRATVVRVEAGKGIAVEFMED